MNRQLHKQIVALRALSLSYYATSAFLIPFLPVYFSEERGYSPFQIGLLMAVGPFVAIFAQPVLGYVSDRMQTTKKILLIIWILAIFASVGLYTTSGFPLSFAFVLLLYFFTSPSSPLMDSIIQQSTQRAGKSYGSVRSWGSFGFAFVALIAGTMISWSGGMSKLPYLYWAMWIFPLLPLFWLKDERRTGASLSLGTVKNVILNRQFLWFMFIILLLSIPHRMNDSWLGIYLKDLGATDEMVGWAWAISAFSEIPAFILLGRYIHKFHELSLLGFIALFYAIRWFLVGGIDDPWLLLLVQVMHSVTFGMFWITAVHYVSRVVSLELRSTGQAVLASVFGGMANIIGSSVGGWIKGEWGGAVLYECGGVLALLASILFFATHYANRKRKLS